jgi:FAD/FMN-containing dehydrogenase
MTIAPRPNVARRPYTSTRAELERLRPLLDGELITADHAGFDAARKLVSISVDRRPLAMVRAASARDVAAAVRFAVDNSLSLSVRSGGHSLAHHSVIDNALVVDLSAMKRVAVDPEQRIAYVQAGATSGDLAGPAHAHGLALSTGDTHSVGMGGLTTGGGIGFMVRKQGLAIDNLLAAQVVTAAGEIVRASADENPDLFWAIRGGGGNFGIVTEFTYRLSPVGQIYGGELLLPATREVLRGYLDYAVAAPDELTTIANLMHAPPAPHVPPERVGEEVLSILVCWTGTMADGERAVAPLRALATPVADAVGPLPYPEIYRFTAHQAEPHGASIRMMFADALSDATLDAALAALRTASSPFSIIQFRGLGGAMARVADDATAFAHRGRRYFVAPIAIWLDPAEEAARHTAWTMALWERMRPEGAGVYVNFLENEGAGRVREAYPGATLARLAAIKARYDPQNLFCFNQNIRPQSNT